MQDTFWRQVEKTDTCWLWKGRLTPAGYGMFGRQFAHRVSHLISKGEIPAKFHVDHLCRVRHCVNPDHLEAVPAYVNVLRGLGTGAKNARKKFCDFGHPLSAGNLYVYHRAIGRRRICRSCETERARSLRRREREAMLRQLEDQLGVPADVPRCRRYHALIGDNVTTRTRKNGSKFNLCKTCRMIRDFKPRGAVATRNLVAKAHNSYVTRLTSSLSASLSESRPFSPGASSHHPHQPLATSEHPVESVSDRPGTPVLVEGVEIQCD